jgi:hypothetical protein
VRILAEHAPRRKAAFDEEPKAPRRGERALRIEERIDTRAFEQRARSLARIVALWIVQLRCDRRVQADADRGHVAAVERQPLAEMDRLGDADRCERYRSRRLDALAQPPR